VKIYNQTAFRLVVVFFAIVAIMIAPEFPPDIASGVDRKAGPQTIVERAKVIPVSNRVITAKFSDDEKDITIEASHFEGGLTRIEKVGEAIYGFVPVISDSSKQTVVIRVYRISQEDAGGRVIERLNEVSSLVADKAGGYVACYADANGSFKIEVKNIQTDWVAMPPVGSLSDSLKECCLECMGVVMCSGKLSTPCGGCCSGDWCRD
jgi:uncharacterized protein (DUF39 family)